MICNMEEIKKLVDATLVVKSVSEDDNSLCEVLNSLDKNFVRNYYKFESDGPVVMLRKDICKEILLNDIDTDTLKSIIESHREKNPTAFKSWKTNFSLLHTLILNKFKEELEYLPKLAEDISKELGDVNFSCWDFRGGRNQGQKNLSIAFYNQRHKNHSIGKQLFLDFTDGQIKYGIYKHGEGYLVEPEFCSVDDFSKVLEFFLMNLDIIKNDITFEELKEDKTDFTFLSAAMRVLKDNKNKPMSTKEIWDEIEERGLYKSDGKTPIASLSTILGAHSKNSNNKSKSDKIHLEVVGDKPVRYRLIRYVSDIIRESLIEDGFITKDQLIEIFKSLNLDPKI